MNRLQSITYLSLVIFTASCSTLKNNPHHKEHADKKRAIYSEKLGIELAKGFDEALIKEVIEWLGTPYVHGGEDKSGADCSGFVMQVYKTVYKISTARSASGIYDQSIKVNRNHLKQGELVFFKINTIKVGHVGILLFDPFFIHASSSKGVMISSLDSEYWTKYFVSGGRIIKSI
jgi:lipoprotein Spr